MVSLLALSVLAAALMGCAVPAPRTSQWLIYDEVNPKLRNKTRTSWRGERN